MNQEDVFLEKTVDFARKHHEKDITGHDFFHIQRVYQNVCLLLKENRKADAFIVKMAALLHDVDDRKLNFGEKQTSKFLNQINVPTDKIKQIIETIDAIDFGTTGRSPDFDTIEKAILFDADKLDAMGAIGIYRTITYGHAKNRRFFNPDLFPKKDITKEEYRTLPIEKDVTINHFFDKLLKLSSIMQTKAGKKEAAKRHKIMVQFLSEFFRENGEDKWVTFLKQYLKEL